MTGDDTVSMYRRGELKEILKKRKRKRHPIEYLVKRKFSWEKEVYESIYLSFYLFLTPPF